MSTTTGRARAVWFRCLASAFRTALACAIVGCTTLYGPASIRHHIAFPAFSYVTVILIVTDATLGDALHGCWLALYATVQSLGPALLSLRLIGPARLSRGTISVAVALGAFLVVFPRGTHLVARRIALGQTVIVYVIAYINGVNTEATMHPLHVAASTAIGVLACVLALLLPYPRLACWELRLNCERLAENVSERLNLYVKAFCAEDNALGLAYISQAKPLTVAGAKLLQSIKRYQESVKWERLPLRFLRNFYSNPGERLEELEIPLRGMEMALTSCTASLPVRILDGETIYGPVQLEENVSLTQKQIKNCLLRDSLTAPESNAGNLVESHQTLQTISTRHQDLPSFFFLFCMKLLHCKSLAKPITPTQQKGSSTPCKQTGFFKSTWMSNWSTSVSRKRLMPAFKCSLSLGLAVLFGLIYSKKDGYWSGLTVAISLAAAREATFKVSNVKAQGTVLGTVYGVFGCFVFERYLSLRFISLLPWFVVTNFLRHSKMYGQAGGISAVIGAVLVLGRKNFGPPSEFAIARIVETFIGLSCSIMVDLLLQPTRASSLAKVQLLKCFETLSACIGSISLAANNRTNLLENQRRLKMDVSELGKFIAEAEVEPNFWFLPFHSSCYFELLGSFSKLVDLLLLSADAVGLLEHESQKFGASWKESLNKLDGDLELFKEMAGSLVKCFEDVAKLLSLKSLEKELENKSIPHDLEMGKSSNRNIFKVSGLDEDRIDSIISSYLQHSKEMVDKFHAADEGGRELKSQVVLCLSALGFCMSNLIKETSEIKKRIIEILQWENPSKHINLHEISCKIRALYTTEQYCTNLQF
uniref:Integral membrane bound transporter domain-containing protein n=1 Tax=Salix viminalis TaxID=40686 RepID=A0A6N2KDE1_SALVM